MVFNFYGILIISLLFTSGVFLVLFYLIGFTRWRMIDFFRLNKILGVPRVKDLSEKDVYRHFSYFVWGIMNRRSVLRNGCRVMEIFPLSAQEGHRYVVISKDNRPFRDVCYVTVDTDIAGIQVKATVIAQETKDFENMMNIMNWDIKEVFRNLREIEAGVETAKQNIIDRYIDYMMREVL